jgi:hypothetical protein
MKSNFKAQCAIALSLLLLTLSANADVISGKIEFIKKPPFTGLLYVADGGPADEQPVLDQKGKAFTRKIAVGSPSKNIKFMNSDTFDHNVYANDAKQKVKFDVGLMSPGNNSVLSMDWPEETLVRVGCKIHPKMRTYIANVKSKHFQSFEFSKKIKSYDIKIDRVSSNSNQLVLLMPKYDKLTIELKKGESKTLDVLRKGKVKGKLTLTRR